MKNILLLVTAMLFAVTQLSAEGKSTEVCKTYIDQVRSFKHTMKNDEVSKKTLAFYENKMKIHCGNIVSKKKFEKKSFIEMMAKKDNKTTAECRQAIDMASEYSKTKNQLPVIVAAHKENIADNCGTLVASHVSAYCLYDEAQ